MQLSSATNWLEGTNDKVDLGALAMEYDLGFATLIVGHLAGAPQSTTPAIDLTALYSNFFFYQNFYGQNPRTFVQGRDQLDDRVVSQEFRLTSKTGGILRLGRRTVLQGRENLHPGARVLSGL